METTLDFQIGEIHRNLELLFTQWKAFVEKKKSGGGIAARARQLFDSKHDNDQLSVVTVPISQRVNRIRHDWDFIDLSVKCILNGNAAAAAAAKKSLVPKSKAVADAILSEVYSCVFSNQSVNYYLRKPQEILNLLEECQRKTDNLCKSEIRGALAEFVAEGKVIGSVEAHFNFFDVFLPLLAKNLQLIKDAGSGNLDSVHSEMLWIHRYLNAVQKDIVGSDFGDEVGAFLTRAELLVLRIAFQSCNLWFSRTNLEAARAASDAILDLQREIQPSKEQIILLNAELFLKEQIHTRKPSMMLGDSQILKVNMILTTLRTVSDDRGIQILCKQGNTFVKDCLELYVELGKEIDSLHRSFHFEDSVKHFLLQLLFKIAFFKSESFLIDLLKSDDANMSKTPHEKDQIISIVEYLQYFKRFVMNKLARNSSTEAIIIRQVEATVRDITLLSYLYPPVRERFLKIRSSLPMVLDNAKRVKGRLREIDQQFSNSVFPKINALGSIGRNISELLKHDPQTIAPVRHQIQKVLLHLQSLDGKLKDLDAELGEWNDIRNQVIEVAYKLEYVVQTIEADGHSQQSLWLYNLLEDISIFDQRVSEIHEMPHGTKVKNPSRAASPMAPPNANAETNEMLIDLVDEEVIVDRLTRGSAQRDVVSIVGMPGIGKTTLARKVYNSLAVTYYFHRRAWCTVSQTYSKRELLLEIMSHMPFLTGDISQMSEDDLLEKLRKSLKGNKYLIVMDDVWDTAAWNDFNLCFPDDDNGSRILITSRLQDVVLKIRPGCDPHSISLLSDAQSWMLLQKKIFGDALCPKGLMESGKEIAQYCQGLPQ